MPTIWNKALLVEGSSRKVIVSAAEVARFNEGWPGSTLRSSRAYWFEFDAGGDLVDTDCPEHDDGPAASAMAEDCKAFAFDDDLPSWGEGFEPDTDDGRDFTPPYEP